MADVSAFTTGNYPVDIKRLMLLQRLEFYMKYNILHDFKTSTPFE